MQHTTHHLRRIVFLLAALTTLAWSGPALSESAAVCCDAVNGGCRQKPHAYDGTKVALLFGVSEYSGKLTPLPNATNDARDFAKILHENGFSVRCVHNPGRREALGELKVLASYVFQKDLEDKLLLEDTRVIVYFAGHGFQLDGVDYFFFANDKPLSNRAQIQEVALSRREVFDEFAGLEKFEPHYVFDSCRQLFDFQLTDSPNVVARGGLHSANISNTHPRHAVGGYYVVHSTTKNNVALDSSPPHKIVDNGVFMARFKEHVAFPNLEMQRAVQFTVRDLQLLGITSVPSQEGAGQFSQQTLSIRRSTSACEFKAANIWGQTAHCRRLEKECTLPKVCSYLEDVTAHRSADVACLKPMLEEKLGYDPVALCATEASVRKPVFERTELAEFSSPALDASRNFVSRFANLSVESLKLPLDVVGHTEPHRPLPPETQSTVRMTLLPPKGSSKDPVPVIAFASDVGLKTIPSSQGGNIRVLQPETRLTLNCDTTYCSPQWAAVTANVNRQVFRGWVATSQLVPALELRYLDNALYPSRSDLAAFKLRLSMSNAARSPVQLTAVQPKGSVAVDLTESRLIRLKTYAMDLGVPEDRITMKIVDVEKSDARPFIEFNAVPDLSSNLPIAYQPMGSLN